MFMQLICSVLASFSLMSAKPNIRGDTQAPNSRIEVSSNWQEYNVNKFYLSNGKYSNDVFNIVADNGVLNVSSINNSIGVSYNLGTFVGKYLGVKAEGALTESYRLQLNVCIGSECEYLTFATNDWQYLDLSKYSDFTIAFVNEPNKSLNNLKIYFMLSDNPLEGKDFIPNLRYLVEETYNKGYQEGYNKGYQEGYNKGYQEGYNKANELCKNGMFGAYSLSYLYDNDNLDGSSYEYNLGFDYDYSFGYWSPFDLLSEKFSTYFPTAKSFMFDIQFKYDLPISVCSFDLIGVDAIRFVYSENPDKQGGKGITKEIPLSSSLITTINVSDYVSDSFFLHKIELISNNLDNLSKGYIRSSSSEFINGYLKGQSQGYLEGINDKQNNQNNFDKGYQEGYNKGVSESDFNPFFWLASLGTMLMGIFSIELFPGFSVGGLILIPLILAIVAVVIGFFGKGGK